MTERMDRAGLQVDAVLARFVEDEALPGTGIGAEAFWSGFAGLLADVFPGSLHVRTLAGIGVSDERIWQLAIEHACLGQQLVGAP